MQKTPLTVEGGRVVADKNSVRYTTHAMAQQYVLKSSADPTSFRVDYRAELNDEQYKVVTEGEGACLVLAGAGSGKTRTIVYRVAYLLERGVKADEILLVTFTNKAAKQMLFRIEELLGAYPKGLWGGTFHHVANLFLHRYANLIGYTPNFSILDEEDSRSLIGLCLRDQGIDTKARRFPAPGVLSTMFSLAVNTQAPIGELLELRWSNFLPLQNQIENVFTSYKERKKRNNQMDFDDLLIQFRRLLIEHPAVAQRLSQQFRYVLVDEFQDTNPIQADIVTRLSASHKNLLVVGDDAQSIYAFRGADIRHILDFPKTHNGTRMFRLETNYRSTQPILDVANAVIAQNKDQFAKHLMHVREGSDKPLMVPTQSEEQEADYVTQRILELREEGVPLREIAVLFRASFHSQALEFELTRRDIPYEYRGGIRFFERAHIKDVLAFLRIVNNAEDEIAWHRTLTLQVGIGPETANKIIAQIRAGGVEPATVIRTLEALSLGSRASDGVKAYRSILRDLLSHADEGAEALVRVVKDSDYQRYLETQYPNASERVDDIEQLALFASRYRSLDSFLKEVTLQEAFGVAGAAAAERDTEQIILSTIHQAKGLEWEAVFVIHLTANAFPNPRAMTEEGGMAEERRLFYVATTRAKKWLTLTYPIGANMRTMSMHINEPSPFLTEVSPKLFERVDIVEEELVVPEFDDADAIIELDDDGAPKGILDRVIAAKKGRRKKN